MVEIVVMTRPEAGVGLEAPVSRRVSLFVKSQMPLADDVGAVSQISQILRQNLFVEWQSSGFGSIDNLNRSWDHHRDLIIENHAFSKFARFLNLGEHFTYLFRIRPDNKLLRRNATKFKI